MQATGPQGRIPPYSEEAERGILGSALLNAERVIDLCIERKISANSFYYQAHRVFFDSLVNMHIEGKVIDVLTFNDYLKSTNNLEKVGGAVFVQQVIDSTPTAAHAEHYIDLVYQKFLLRSIIEHSSEFIDACYGEEADASQILSRAESELFAIGENKTTGQLSWRELIDISIKKVAEMRDSDRKTTGIPSGYADFDKMLHGLQPTDMIVLAARPSMGKTSLALNMAENIALGVGSPDGEGLPVVVFSLEMAAEQLAQRMLACHSKVPFGSMRGGFISQDFFGRLTDGAKRLQEAPIYIDDTPGLDVLEMRSRARRMARVHGIKFIVIDYLQLMNYDKFSRDGRQREVAGISGQVKAMAKELNVPVLVLSQLSRAPETRDRLAVPKLSDLRESGAIEQDADVVMLLRRPARYPDDPDHDDEHLSIVDVAKHRNGATGEVRLNFFGEYTRFENRIEIDEEGVM